MPKPAPTSVRIPQALVGQVAALAARLETKPGTLYARWIGEGFEREKAAQLPPAPKPPKRRRWDLSAVSLGPVEPPLGSRLKQAKVRK